MEASVQIRAGGRVPGHIRRENEVASRPSDARTWLTSWWATIGSRSTGSREATSVSCVVAGPCLAYVEGRTLSQTFRFADGILGPSTAFVKRNPEQTQRPLLSASGAEDEGVAVVADASPVGGVTRALQDIEVKARGQQRTVTVLVLGRYRHLEDALPTPSRGGSLRIEFSTVHGAKGREADYVIVLDLNDGRWGFPSKVEDDPLAGARAASGISGGVVSVCGGTASLLRGDDACTDWRIPGDGPCAAIYVRDGAPK